MPDNPSPPGTPPGQPPSGKRPALGLQLKLPCATQSDVKIRYGHDLKAGRFFIRTKQPRPAQTLVRLEVLLQSGAPCFRAAGVVTRAREAPQPGAPTLPRAGEPGMELQFLAVDEAGRELIVSLGGKPPPPLKADAGKGRETIAHAPPVMRPGEKPPAPRPLEPPAPRTGPIKTAPPKPAGSLAATPAPPKKPARTGPVIGIDLGTTNSCAAAMKDGKPFVIPSREGYNTVPSIVALTDKGKLIVGHPAKSQLLINPRNTIAGAKRLIGRAFSSAAVQDMTGRFAYDIIEGRQGEAAVKLGGQVVSLQQISSLVLAEVKSLAEAHLATEVTRAVITVPAHYNDNQRQAVREAGGLAGLRVERIVNEPTAAALAFGYGRDLHQRVLVYDLGGGTFDASVLDLNANMYEVVSTGGDTFLGGVDFDKVIVDHLLASFKDQHGMDFPGDRVALQRVTDAAERAKIALSEQLEVHVKVPFVAMVGEKGYDLETKLTRSELVLLTNHLIDRTLKVCEDVLAARGLRTQEIDEVLLVGGQSRMPLVRERIRTFFGREPSKAVHPDEAVALGAALLAHSIDSTAIDGVVLIDVLPMSIGVGLPGGRFKKIVDRNTSLPHKRSYSIATSKDDQEELEITIFQGESENAQDNEYLGTLTVPDLRKGPRGSVAYNVLFALSPEALLTVTAEEHGTGRSVSATFSTKATPDEIREQLSIEVTPVPPVLEPQATSGNGVRGLFHRFFRKGSQAEQ